MSQLDRATNKANIDSQITANGTGAITGPILNAILKDLADSYANLISELGKIGLVEYLPSQTYNAGNTVVFEGGIYQANENGITGVFNAVKWTLLAKVEAPTNYDFVPYDNGTTYNIGDRVLYLNRFFICDANGTIGITPDDSAPEWSEVSASLQADVPAPEWFAGYYLQDQVVRHNQKLYYLDIVTPPSYESTDIDAEILAGDWKMFNESGTPDAPTIKSLYESNPDTNAFTDAEKTLLSNQSGTNTGDEPNASESERGIIEVATQSETDNGTDDLRAITPLKLKNRLDTLNFIPIIIVSTGLSSTLGLPLGITVIGGTTHNVVNSGTYIVEYSVTVRGVGAGEIAVGAYLNGGVSTTNVRRIQFNQGGGGGVQTKQAVLHLKSAPIIATAGNPIDIRANVISGTFDILQGSYHITRIS